MKAILKIAGILVLLLVTGLAILTMMNWTDLKNFRPMASNVYSKFMCSCLFVEGRTEEQCVIWSRVVIPVSGYEVDYNNKSVTARALGLTGTSRYMGERYGCTIE